MPTFGELLSIYMTRTGISDSELARTLGVSRQTVFRWKEQLVARPRHRDDVLACARRLRLTPEETDQLLLAAGFAPQNVTGLRANATAAPGVGSGMDTDPDTDTDTDTELGAEIDADINADIDAEILVDDTRTPYSRRWLFGGLAAAGLLALGFAAWAALGRPTPTTLPVARSGESLVLVASQLDAAGNRRPNSAVETALRREITGLRLAGIRIAAWPEPVADAAAATIALQSSGATVILWPAEESEGGVEFTQAPMGGTAAATTSPAAAWPSGATVTDPRLVALLTLAAVAHARGDVDDARGLLVQALPLAEVESEVQAAVRGALGEAEP